MPNHQASGNGRPGSRRHRSRHHGLRYESPARSSNPNDEDVGFGITRERPRDSSPHYETHDTSSRRNSHHTTISSRWAADGSENSMSQSDTRDYRYASRHTERNIARSPDPYDYNVPFSDFGGWINDPQHRRLPEPTYGHNGYNPTEYPRTLSGSDIFDPPREARRSSQQYIQPTSHINGGGGPSRREERLPRSRSRERHADDRREHHNPRERHERRERREHREYHEAHAYSEHRDRDQRRYASPEPIFHESNGRRRRHRSRSREPRCR